MQGTQIRLKVIIIINQNNDECHSKTMSETGKITELVHLSVVAIG